MFCSFQKLILIVLKVSRLFAAIEGARLVDSGQWAIPCETTVPISFTFGSVMRSYFLHCILTLKIQYGDILYVSYRLPQRSRIWQPKFMPILADGSSSKFGWSRLAIWGGFLAYRLFGIQVQFPATWLPHNLTLKYSFGIDEKEPPLIGLYPLRNDTNITESPAEIDSYLSAYSATIATTFPNYLLPTPTLSVPPYTFNSSVPAVQGGIVSTELANTTYTPIFGEQTTLDNVSALPTIYPPPSVITLTVTESGRVSTMTETMLTPSIMLGIPISSAANTRLDELVLHQPFFVMVWTLILVWTL